jgi:hypothetical protein
LQTSQLMSVDDNGKHNGDEFAHGGDDGQLQCIKTSDCKLRQIQFKQTSSI